LVAQIVQASATHQIAPTASLDQNERVDRGRGALCGFGIGSMVGLLVGALPGGAASGSSSRSTGECCAGGNFGPIVGAGVGAGIGMVAGTIIGAAVGFRTTVSVESAATKHPDVPAPDVQP